jgi:hypothetical protein
LALYVPQSRRRRRTFSLAAAVGVLGLVSGGVLGRVTAPTVAERVSSVRADARDTASGLRVISLHGEAAAVGAGGADLVLNRTGTELAAEFADAPWLSGDQKAPLLSDLAALKAMPNRDGTEFGDAAARLAQLIDDTFNGKVMVAPAPAPEPAPTFTPSPAPSPAETPTPSPTESAGPAS